MTSSNTALEPADDVATASLRSRASSVVTTTTRFSLETLSQDDTSSIGAAWGRQHQFGNVAGRPHSVTSITNPAPPYTEAVNPTLQLPSHQNGEFQSLLSRLAEVAERPTEAVSLNEPLAPSTIASGDTPPAPDSPLDPDLNPSAQVAYYSSVVRTLDSNYTADLERLRQKHVQELAATRHEIDAAYRAQWKTQNRQNERIREEAAKARDEEVHRIKTESDVKVQVLEARVQELESALVMQAEEWLEQREKAVEKARHEVEDTWEKRWRDRSRIEAEEKERADVERQKAKERERVKLEREKELQEAFKKTVKEWMSSNEKLDKSGSTKSDEGDSAAKSLDGSHDR
ncbi:MAG: hypothetical protein Q9169_000169 [Polycauliona sp. 2 TL-2023]